MQLPTTLTGGDRINRVTAGALGLALLAAVAAGAIPIAAEGRNDETGSQMTEEIYFLEQNVWDYDEFARPGGEADAWMSTEEIHFLEQNVWDYDEFARPGGEADAWMSTEEIHFLEQNVWDYDELAQPGGDADAPESAATLPHGERGEAY